VLAFNSFLSFHDNYADLYPGTPFYNKDLIVVKEDGTPEVGVPPNCEDQL